MNLLAQAEQRKLHSYNQTFNIDIVLVDVAYANTVTLLEVAQEFLRTCASLLIAARRLSAAQTELRLFDIGKKNSSNTHLTIQLGAVPGKLRTCS